MPAPYEHQFADLHSDASDPEPTVVDLSEKTGDTQDAQRVKLNPAPGNPDKGKTDQFDDLPGAKATAGADVDDGVDVDLVDANEVTPPEEGADEDDLKGLSKPVQERILRERRLRQESEERSRRTEAELAQLTRKVDLAGKETEWTTADAKDDAELGKLKSDKIAAIEAGDTAKQVEIDDKISDVKARKISRDGQRTTAREAAAKPVTPSGDPAAKTPKAAEWISKHPQYNTDPLFREAANAADRTLFAQGFNSNSADYYVRLSRIMNESGRFQIHEDYLKTRKQPRGGPRDTGSTGVRTGNNQTVRRTDSGRITVTVTKEDKMLLASMGVDPDDPAVLRNFAREKAAQLRAEQRGGE